jgi:cell division protein FtsI/penicillin-binding protein 2
LLRRITILTVALLWLWGSTLEPLSVQAAGKPDSTSTPSPKAAVQSKPRKAMAGNTLKKRTSSRRRRRPSPWRVSSFADPTLGDDPSGEDPLVREAAVEALGNWNGSVVVVDPNTGRILSIVNQRLALGSAFTPCSTFKPIVGLAALKEGTIKPEEKLRIGRHTRMNLTEALAHSNNPFFALLGRKLGFERVAEYARRFGLGEKAGWNIPGESPGSFPSAPPKEGGVGLLSSHGYKVEVTPLQMAAAISAIANGGTLYHLQYPRTAEELAFFEPKIRRRLDDLAGYLPQVREGLAAAVLYGTARSAFSLDEQIYGKTGTCSEDGARLGWFVSYASERDPRYVVVVLLRGGKPMFGPHAAEIAGRLYRILREKEQNATPATQASSRVFLPSE